MMSSVLLGDVLELSIDAVGVEPAANYHMAGVYSFGRGLFARGPLSGSNTTYRVMHRLHADHFVVSQLKAWEGALGRIPHRFDGWYLSPQFPTFKPVESRLNIRFLDWYCKQPELWDRLRGASQGMGARRDSVSPSRFLNLPIDLPGLSEQRAIAQHLDEVAAAADTAQAHRTAALAASEALRPALRAQVVRPGPGWRETTVEAVCTAIVDNLHSNPSYAPDGVPCIRSSDVGWGILNLASARRTTEEEYIRRTIRGEPSPGDVVFVREGGGTGKAALVQPSQRFSLGQRVMMLRPNSDVVLPEFFLEQLLSPIIQEEQLRPQILGSASPHLNIGSLRRFRFLLPSMDDQRAVVDQLALSWKRWDALRHIQALSQRGLDALRASALSGAMAAPRKHEVA